MQDIEPVNTEIMFESLVESILLAILDFSYDQDSIITIEVNDSAIKSCSHKVKFLLDTSMKDIKLIVAEIHGFEYWGISLLKALFGSFG